ncbi:hypothetical protein [Desulfocurvibacter africanus]|uniref:hypothetical protein n=1 Tax=Desulfocurvibacter africanus TaxID=873 RepID=UPI0003FC77C6|nr:hypothetical protein [Desulfocurvibacter africanus]
MAEGKNTAKGTQDQERTTTYLDLSVLRNTKDTALAALAVAIVAVIFCGGLAAYTHNALQKMGATDSRSQGQAAILSEQMTSRMDELGATMDQRLSALRSDVDQQLSSRDNVVDQHFAALEQSMLSKLRSLESKAVSPKQVTQQINSQQARTALREVSGQAEALGGRIDNPELQAKLAQVRKLLNELEQGVRQ